MNRNFYQFIILLSIFFIIVHCIDSNLTKPDEEESYYSTIIEVNAAIPLGNFIMSMGVNCGPLSTDQNTNYSKRYHELGIKIIRTHDYYGPCDWYTIFPDWELDENNQENYNFFSSDQIINNIISSGFEVLFRLGPSWNDPVYTYNNDPPGTLRDNQENITHIADHSDFLKFSVICKNIVRHYNNGWANGYFFNIKRWEIWNEPSLSSHFWSGTAQQFYDMFYSVFTELKEYDQTLIVGGPGLAGQSSNSYETGFIEFLKNNNINIDFFSWHNYGNEGGGGDNAIQSPAILGNRADFVRNNLDNEAFNSVSSVCSEWNSDLGSKNFADSGKGAAFYGGALTLMESKGITENYLYRGDNHPLGIMKDNGDLKIAAYVLKCWKSLSDGNIRIMVTNNDLDEFYVIASRSQDNSQIYILLSNFSTVEHRIRLDISNADTVNRTSWNKTVWEINDFKKFEIVAGPASITESGGKFKIEVELVRESVKFLKLSGSGSK